MALQNQYDLSFFIANIMVNRSFLVPAFTPLVFFRIKAFDIAGCPVTFHSVGYVGIMFSFLIIFALLQFFLQPSGLGSTNPPV